ncbi:MAG: hypothetical protein KA714_19350 [Limnoraphis sp. WC205]|jgi:hypothetical protein|nr:hypothetical protein [Limnoraphis sp. WC205]
MTGSLKAIEEDLASLEEAIAKLAHEFDHAYENYLTALGKAVRQQLILASYHLCTQGYPESFLKLSFSQRQKFQQNLQTLATNAQKTLLSLVQLSSASQALKEQPEDDDSLEEDFTPEDESVEVSTDFLIQQALPQPLSSPERLALWQEKLEKSINAFLKTLSRDANRCLQKSEIFPQKLPEALLEAASLAETSAQTVASPPNLLNLMIETEDIEDEEISNVTRVMAVHLRLSEVEFADTAVMSKRHQIRNLCAQLNKLGRSYQKKQRERAVLEAEAAWRASWFEQNA